MKAIQKYAGNACEMVRSIPRGAKRLVVGAGGVFAAGSALAQSSGASDPTTITSSATTAFNAVTVLVVAMVSFYIIVRIVKGIRK